MQATATTLISGAKTFRSTHAQSCRRSLIGTAIEFFRLYIYATAAVIVFRIFLPAGRPDGGHATVFWQPFYHFVARPIGSALFGHFGDRIGRKVTLVASLPTMGIFAVAIGPAAHLRDHRHSGTGAKQLARFGQGLGLGGEWGGLALLATENAPARKRRCMVSSSQSYAPIGFFFANGTSAGFRC
ncbi:MFS transporter [Enterobacter cloacae subsp. cloacae]|nr:MFS transporter [Enterobacter cloacae subsp. cloacae]